MADALQAGDLPAVDETAATDAIFNYLEGIWLMAKSRKDTEVIRTLGVAVTSIQVPLRA